MAQEPDGTGFAAWIAGFRDRALDQGISAPVLDRALRGVAFQPDVIRRDRRQAEFTKTIWDYLDIAVSDLRVEYGLAALRRHGATLDRIAAETGVDGAVVAAIWGLESSYGANRGDVPVLDALASLAQDGRRAAFFEAELLAALRILAADEARVADLRGSWAGAMGHTQFMPSSFLAHAVDGDGDGRRNIWGEDPTDALASTAAYLRHWGWTPGQPWGLEVALPPGFDVGQSGAFVVKPVAEWQALGVRPAAGGDLPDHGPAILRLPAGVGGAAFLTFANFQVIERYNPADAYVIAVGHLADRLRGGGPIRAPWPRGDRALTADERVALQRRLARAGFDPGGADGRIGPLTIAAVREFQRARGLPPDGYANPALLALLPPD